LEWRIGRLPGLGHDSRWSIAGALASGILAAGLRSVTNDLPRIVAFVIVMGPAVLVYLAITATTGVTEARLLLGRGRRLLRV